jgi:hypothetical protein
VSNWKDTLARTAQLLRGISDRRKARRDLPCSERYFPGLRPVRRRGKAWNTVQNERPIRRAARKKVASLSGGCFVRFMSDRFRVPATRSDRGLLFWNPNSPGGIFLH